MHQPSSPFLLSSLLSWGQKLLPPQLRQGTGLSGILLKGLQKGAFRGLIQPLGYRLELRRHGDQKLGLMRKRINPKGSRRLVFIPGLGDTPLAWFTPIASLQPALRQHYDEVVFIDFPGFAGLLSDEPAIDSFEGLRDFLFDTLDTLKPSTLTGHSLGGWLAALYQSHCGAGLRPMHSKNSRHTYNGAEKLVLICPAGLKTHDEEMYRWRDIFHAGIDQGFHIYRPHLFAREPLWFRFLAPEFGRFILKPEVQRFIRSISFDDMVNATIGQLKAKTYLLWGDKDSLAPSHWMEDWLRALPAETHALGMRILEAGHSPHVEKTWTTIQLLRKALCGQEILQPGSRAWELVQR